MPIIFGSEKSKARPISTAVIIMARVASMTVVPSMMEHSKSDARDIDCNDLGVRDCDEDDETIAEV